MSVSQTMFCQRSFLQERTKQSVEDGHDKAADGKAHRAADGRSLRRRRLFQSRDEIHTAWVPLMPAPDTACVSAIRKSRIEPILKE